MDVTDTQTYENLTKKNVLERCNSKSLRWAYFYLEANTFFFCHFRLVTMQLVSHQPAGHFKVYYINSQLVIHQHSKWPASYSLQQLKNTPSSFFESLTEKNVFRHILLFYVNNLQANPSREVFQVQMLGFLNKFDIGMLVFWHPVQ